MSVNGAAVTTLIVLHTAANNSSESRCRCICFANDPIRNIKARLLAGIFGGFCLESRADTGTWLCEFLNRVFIISPAHKINDRVHQPRRAQNFAMPLAVRLIKRRAPTAFV